MDDLVGGLFLLVAFAGIIAMLIAVALAMAAAGAVVGSLLVGFHGTGVFLASLSRRVRTRGAADRHPAAPEPAFQLYALGQLRADLRSSGNDAWEAMQDGRRFTADFRSRCTGVWTPRGIGALIGGVAGTAIGAVVSFLLTLPVLLAAGLVIAGAWLMIGLLRAAEAVRRRVRRTSYECPVDHERFPLPVYVCPGCGAEHRRLVPGRWGVVKRECQCGRVWLPTMVLNGRQRVPQQCPSGHPMAGIIGYAEIVRLALVAGPSAGKTTFLAGALLELEQLSTGGTLALGVVEQSRSDYDATLATLRDGRVPTKTQVGRNPALVAEVQGGGRSRVLSLYDVAGEAYAGEEAILDLRFLEVPSGLVMLVDPLALERFAVDHEDEIADARDRLGPSPVSPMRVLERTLGALASAGVRTDRLPLAVLVGKDDALGIGDEIEALRERAGDRAVPEWLQANGGGAVVQAVEDAFPVVGWFHASALGRMPDPGNRRAFVPSGTAAPLLWLLERKGVVPAAAPFTPARGAERLMTSSAQDFPPIGQLGWALRALPSVVAAALVASVLAFGALAGVRALPGGTGDSLAAVDTAHKTGRLYRRAAFTVRLPRSWRVTARADRRAGYLSNRWRAGRNPRVIMRIDTAHHVRTVAIASARGVRAIVRRNSSYRELKFKPTLLRGRYALRWEFMLKGLRKVDFFVNACGNGYAILGAAPPKRWRKYVRTFDRAARSLRPRC